MDERIRQRAYEIWEREGRPEGREAEHWRMAVEELAASSSAASAQDVPATRVRGPAKLDESLQPPDAAQSASAGSKADNVPAAPSPDPQSDPLGLAQPINKTAARRRNGPARNTKSRVRPEATPPTENKTPDRTR
jgi:hypothetical protein